MQWFSGVDGVGGWDSDMAMTLIIPSVLLYLYLPFFHSFIVIQAVNLDGYFYTKFKLIIVKYYTFINLKPKKKTKNINDY